MRVHVVDMDQSQGEAGIVIGWGNGLGEGIWLAGNRARAEQSDRDKYWMHLVWLLGSNEPLEQGSCHRAAASRVVKR